MLIQYEWMASFGDVPAVATYLDLSGDPDQPVLRGVVAKHVETELVGGTVISILIADGQDGAQAFQEWLEDAGDLGVAISPRQTVDL